MHPCIPLPSILKLATQWKELDRSARISHSHYHQHRPFCKGANQTQADVNGKRTGSDFFEEDTKPFSSFLLKIFLYGYMYRKIELARYCVASHAVRQESREGRFLQWCTDTETSQ